MRACIDCGRMLMFPSTSPKRCRDCERDHIELSKEPKALGATPSESQAPKLELAIKPATKQYWQGPKPTSCNICHALMGKVFYDAATRYGWAIICHPCFLSHGYGLGIGKGQKYNTATLEKMA